jgi:hypothetical protein
MSEDDPQMTAPKGMEIGVNFPFTLVIEHAALDLPQMFAVTKAFDLYEMQEDLSDREGLVKENMLVDVLEITPTETLVKVTPAFAMPYPLLAKHTELMIKQIAKDVLKGKAKVTKIKWEIDKTGVASDLRGMLRKIS